jgi:hypothetical protein
MGAVEPGPNSVRFPDFVIIGAAKSGTSTLFRYLEQHPSIFGSRPKEPCYFDTDASWERGEAWYASLFSDVRPDQICGEASTNYTRWPQVDGVPERMKALIPDAKLIYVMRDPVTRSYSHFVHRWAREVHPGEPFTESFSQFVAHDLMCLDSSDYVTQIERFLDHYPREQLLLLTFEELAADPQATLSRVFTFLGVEDISSQMPLGMKANETRSLLKNKARDQVMDRYRSIRLAKRLMSPLLPKGCKDWIRQRFWETKAARRRTAQYLPPPLTIDERLDLVRRFAPRNEALRDAYGIDISAWTSREAEEASPSPQGLRREH